MLRDGHVVCTQKVGYEPQCVAVSPAQNEVAVGGGERVRRCQCRHCKFTALNKTLKQYRCSERSWSDF